MANNRGTRFGQYHTSLDPSEAEFWNFMQEDLGLKDLPAAIDYVLGATGQE